MPDSVGETEMNGNRARLCIESQEDRRFEGKMYFAS